MTGPTVYKPVTFIGKGAGTLKLYDNQLSFQMYNPQAAGGVNIFMLPWSKVKKRQASKSATGEGKPKFKLILKSGTEVILQMDDRIALEVLRDDVAERLQRYKAAYPDSDDEAVNHTKTSTAKRESQPYRMAKPATTPAVPAKREAQPYRMAKPAAAAPAPAARAAQPYRMKAKDTTTTASTAKKQSQPYRYVAKK